jgi:branched-chain amino acid aminotransferase
LARSPLTPRWVWLDGRILPAENARISVFDRGFLYGDAVFETVRFYRGRPFRWDAHRRRLAKSLAHFGISAPKVDLLPASLRLLARNRLAEAAVRITVTRGVGEGLSPPARMKPTVLLAARPIPSDLPAQRRDGIALVTLGFGRGVGDATRGHKTTDYLSAIQGRRLAARARARDGLFVEHDGTVSEATASNYFVVRRGRLETPALASGCLPGVTRAWVLEEAKRIGLAVRVGPIEKAGLAKAAEVFLTGSIVEILPVVRIDGRDVADGRPGAVTGTMQARFARAVTRSGPRSKRE